MQPKKLYTCWAKLDLSSDSSLVKTCKNCGAKIVWLKSSRSKYYPVNFLGLIDVLKTDYHKCGQPDKNGNPLIFNP